VVLKRRYGLITNHKKLYRLCRELQLPRPQRPKNPHHLGLTCQAEETANALREAVRRRKPEWQETKPVIRTDNGPQFIGRLFEETCEQLGLEHEQIRNATPNKNAHIEALNGIMEKECLVRNEFQTFAAAYLTVTVFIDFYDSRRLHSGLGYRSPQEFRALRTPWEKWTPCRNKKPPKAWRARLRLTLPVCFVRTRSRNASCSTSGTQTDVNLPARRS